MRVTTGTPYLTLSYAVSTVHIIMGVNVLANYQSSEIPRFMSYFEPLIEEGIFNICKFFQVALSYWQKKE